MKAVYSIRHPHGFHKVGVSGSPIQRYNSLRVGTPYNMELYAVLITPFDDNRIESELHELLDAYHWKREWYNAPDKVLDNAFESYGRRNGFSLSYPKLNTQESPPRELKFESKSLTGR